MTFFEHTNDLLSIQWGVVICASLVAAVTDIRTRRIPNVLTISLLFSGLIFNLLNYGGIAFIGALGACVFLAVPFILLYAFAGGGAGDAKLMGAIGAWVGLEHGLYVLSAVVFVGAFFGIIFAVVNGQFAPVARRLKAMVDGIIAAVFFNRGKGVREAIAVSASPKEMLYMPYGVAIFAGVTLSATGVVVWPL
jgi:prepilin peptidase CpaA